MSDVKRLTQAQHEEVTRRFRYGDGTLEEENLCLALFKAEARACLYRAMLDEQKAIDLDQAALASAAAAHERLKAAEERRRVTLAACNETTERVAASRSALKAMGESEESEKS